MKANSWETAVKAKATSSAKNRTASSKVFSEVTLSQATGK